LIDHALSMHFRLVLAPSYNTLYTWRGPIAIAIVDVSNASGPGNVQFL